MTHLTTTLVLTALLCSITTAAAQAQTKPATGAQIDLSLPTLWIIGDSTVRNGTKGQMGWGDPIRTMFDTSRINVVNRAIGGRSSRTFRTDGRWEQIVSEAKPGDFVLMQFGHNDPAPLSGDNRERGTIRGTGDETEEVTLTLKPGRKETVHTFGWYLRTYAGEAKAKGMTPIICSYVPRCPRPDTVNATGEKADGHSKPASTGPAEMTSYRLWASQAATATGATFIDLNGIISAKYAAYSKEEIKQKFFSEADYTHTNAAGAQLNAECVVEGLRATDSQLKDFLNAE